MKDYNIKVINEYDIIYSFNKSIFLTNYQHQMFLKLAIYKQIETDIYITLDADIYLINNITINDLFVNNRCKYNKEPMNYHIEWWNNAHKSLNYNIIDSDINNGFSVTPAILYKDIVSGLNTYINNNTKHNLYTIFTLEATEYTLYWVYILYNNYIDRYIAKDIFNCQECVWLKNDILNTNNTFNIDKVKNILSTQFNDNDTLFSLFQSTTSFVYTCQFYDLIIKYIT
jgi:hypothetical protein